ncbi:MAG TPA: DUF2723 domain-containing protein [Burkholderiales bacterium]
MTGSARAPSRADWLQAAAVALLLFILYAATAPRGVALEDDPLFILASYFLGFAHPPGYPLYVLLGKLATLLPVGPVAYRVHLLSGLLGGLACGFLWLCARALVEDRLAAWVAALTLGLSGAFWSQAVIAEVYTLNALFVFALAWLGLAHAPRALPLMAFVFGLSLSNHWPLMLLAAPAFAILLWPWRGEVLRRLPLLAALFVAGLAPYAVMVALSWRDPAIAFYGPIESLRELWHLVSRADYAAADASPSAALADRTRYFGFLAGQLVLQLAFAGAALAAAGCALQRRAWGPRIAGFVTAAFLLTSVALLLLLAFDYDARQKHLFHVYPLPAYGFAALWLALGFDWLARRAALRRWQAATAAAVLIGIALGAGAYANRDAASDWPARYAGALLDTLPRDAVVFTVIEQEFGPLAYAHFVEGRRPDLELRQPGGLLYGAGKRLFHPLRTADAEQRAQLKAFVDAQRRPLVQTQGLFGGHAQQDHWLFIAADKSGTDRARHAIVVEEPLLRFFEDSLAAERSGNAWVAEFQGELRRRYATLLGIQLAEGRPLDARSRRHYQALAGDFFGALGLAEGALLSSAGTLALAAEHADGAVRLMPVDAAKYHQARVFETRAQIRLRLGDKRGAMEELESALRIWPAPGNGAGAELARLRAQR